MSATRFNLIFEGKIESGYDQDEAHRTLEALFEFDTETQADLYNGQAVMLGKSMDAATADSFKRALAGTGVTTYLSPDSKAPAAEETQPGNSVDRRSTVPRRANTARRARLRSNAILPDRRKGEDRRR
ncbi:MAG: hypothetical protein OEV07_10500 [Gammaproteobacteria bacterium]|nr:hypothetical protein [Gammaproteobacteria bacterium]